MALHTSLAVQLFERASQINEKNLLLLSGSIILGGYFVRGSTSSGGDQNEVGVDPTRAETKGGEKLRLAQKFFRKSCVFTTSRGCCAAFPAPRVLCAAPFFHRSRR